MGKRIKPSRPIHHRRFVMELSTWNLPLKFWRWALAAPFLVAAIHLSGKPISAKHYGGLQGDTHEAQYPHATDGTETPFSTYSLHSLQSLHSAFFEQSFLSTNIAGFLERPFWESFYDTKRQAFSHRPCFPVFTMFKLHCIVPRFIASKGLEIQ